MLTYFLALLQKAGKDAGFICRAALQSRDYHQWIINDIRERSRADENKLEIRHYGRIEQKKAGDGPGHELIRTVVSRMFLEYTENKSIHKH